MHYSLLIPHSSFSEALVVPGRLELPTSTLSVWRSNQLSYRTVVQAAGLARSQLLSFSINRKTESYVQEAKGHFANLASYYRSCEHSLQKGGVPCFTWLKA